MNIRIKDISICQDCKNKTCSYLDPTIKENFFGIRSETTVCPLAIMTDGPEEHEKDGIIQPKTHCNNCGLCALYCNKRNLIIEDLKDEKLDFSSLKDTQYNALASSYLNKIFDFAANTNRNKALYFDGYVATKDGSEFLVEADGSDDSLESVRRILGDILLYSKDGRISDGIVVLQSIPKPGNRDVFEVLNQLKEFPSTSHFNVYFTTFNILRHFASNPLPENAKPSDFFFDLRHDDEVSYRSRILNLTGESDWLAQEFQ